jgi:hypothetical protein
LNSVVTVLLGSVVVVEAGDGAVAAVSDLEAAIGFEFRVEVSTGGGRAGVGIGTEMGARTGVCAGVKVGAGVGVSDSKMVIDLVVI